MTANSSTKSIFRQMSISVLILSVLVTAIWAKGHPLRRNNQLDQRLLENSKKNSLDVLKNLENQDFAEGFDFSNLGLNNSDFWKKFNEHFKSQNHKMRKHFAKMRKQLKKNLKKETKQIKDEAKKVKQHAKQDKKAILKAAQLARDSPKSANTVEGPETKTVVYTDKAGNKVIEKSSHSSKKFHTKHGFGVASSTSTTINSMSPGDSTLSINSGGNGVMIVNGRVIPMPGTGAVTRSGKRPLRDFEKFFGNMRDPFDRSNVLMNPFG